MRSLQIASVFVVAAAGSFVFVTAQDAATKEGDASAPPGATLREQASYAIGLNIGENIKRDGLDVEKDELIKGLLDALNNRKPQLSAKQLNSVLTAFQRETQAKTEQKRKTDGDKNKKEGKPFLDANKGKKGVISLPSGLQYSVIKSGIGPTPKLTDHVRTHYHGTFIDGQVFDSTLDNEEPAVIPVSAVIRGWTEALQKMKVGDKWKLFVPSELAYGPDGYGPVGPHAVLVFEIELLGIEKPGKR